jgi:hypothetical protein
MASTTDKVTEPVPAEDVLESLRDPAFDEPLDALVELLSQTKRAFLMGAGCSHCAGLPLMDALTEKVVAGLAAGGKSHEVLDALIKTIDAADTCNIEDYMSELVDLLSIADRRKNRGSGKADATIGDKQYTGEELRTTLADIKQQIRQAISAVEIQISTHREFVRALHRRLQAGKAGDSPPIDYFTVNYDTLVEDSLALERISTSDGFAGGVTGWWDSALYSGASGAARVIKLHGSIDWSLVDGDDLTPRRVRDGFADVEQHGSVLIWPASTKYRETQRDPYAQLMDLFRRVLRPQQHREVVLGVVGYAFGDAHINHELDAALRESDGRLSIVASTSEAEPAGLLAEWVGDSQVAEHVRVYARRGFFHAGEQIVSDADLNWWKFEVLTHLLKGNR